MTSERPPHPVSTRPAPTPPRPPRRHGRARPLIAVAAALGLAAAGLALGTAATAAADPAPKAAARGAALPFTTQQAEAAATNGTVIGPDRTYGTLTAEASERRAVTLKGQGEYVEFTLTEPANSLVVRYSIPDNAQGTGEDHTLSLYVNGAKKDSLDLTSKYAWYYGAYPFTNNPGAGNQHHFYDDTRTLLGDLPAGAKVRLQVDAADKASAYTIDLADFEQVAGPKPAPDGAVSVVDHGADPSGQADSADAFDKAITAARAADKPVWIPKGEFKVPRHVIVDDVTITGAGPWYSVLTGKGVGLYGKYAEQGGSKDVHLSDFAIFGDIRERNDNDQVNGIGGAVGGGSTIKNLWIEHTKVGMWFDGPFDGLTISDTRMRNLTADGLNFRKGISNAVVENSHVRNSGDDGLAMWSHQQPDKNNTFRNNTVELPILANGIAIYGGADITVADNLVKDTLTQGGGLHVGNRHNAVKQSGPVTLERNTLVRTGVLDPNWQFGVGALWFYALEAKMDQPVIARDIDIVDSSYEAIQFIGDAGFSNVKLEDVTITGAGTFALQIQGQGSASFKNVTATGLGNKGVYNCQGEGAFTIIDEGGNSGWDSTYCGPHPDPVYDGGDDPTPPDPDPGTNLAEGKPVQASGQHGGYPAGNAVDGDARTYWESGKNAFPQTLTVDLGAKRKVGRIVLALPPDEAWQQRTQTVAVAGRSGTSGDFGTVAGAKGYTFDPAKDNEVEIDLPDSEQRFLRLTFTANTGWPAGQLSEFEVYSS